MKSNLVAVLLCLSWPATADPVVLRMATPAPDGTGWAREIRALSRSLEERTQGRVRLKWHFGGIAGNELEVGERIQRGQLDGTGSGGILCQNVMPSMRVFRLPALFQDADEADRVVNQLHSTLEAEAETQGLTYLGSATLGPDVYLGRRPIHSLAELRATRLWRWDVDEVGILTSRALGLTVVPAPIEQAARGFDQGRFDGFAAIPAGALAFQWTIQAPFLLDLHHSFLLGCLLVSSRSLVPLSSSDRAILSEEFARFRERLSSLNRRMDEALLGGLFQHQGVSVLPVSETFRAEFFAAANAVRDREGPKLVPKVLIERVQGWLGDYRAERAAAARQKH